MGEIKYRIKLKLKEKLICHFKPDLLKLILILNHNYMAKSVDKQELRVIFVSPTPAWTINTSVKDEDKMCVHERNVQFSKSNA